MGTSLFRYIDNSVHFILGTSPMIFENIEWSENWLTYKFGTPLIWIKDKFGTSLFGSIDNRVPFKLSSPP